MHQPVVVVRLWHSATRRPSSPVGFLGHGGKHERRSRGNSGLSACGGLDESAGSIPVSTTGKYQAGPFPTPSPVWQAASPMKLAPPPTPIRHLMKCGFTRVHSCEVGRKKSMCECQMPDASGIWHVNFTNCVWARSWQFSYVHNACGLTNNVHAARWFRSAFRDHPASDQR